MARSVDFPQPDGPEIEMYSPLFIDRWMPARACVSTSSVTKTFLTSSSEMSDVPFPTMCAPCYLLLFDVRVRPRLGSVFITGRAGKGNRENSYCVRRTAYWVLPARHSLDMYAAGCSGYALFVGQTGRSGGRIGGYVSVDFFRSPIPVLILLPNHPAGGLGNPAAQGAIAQALLHRLGQSAWRGHGEQAVLAVAKEPCRPRILVRNDEAAAGHQLERQIGGMRGAHHDQARIAGTIELAGGAVAEEAQILHQAVGPEITGLPFFAGGHDRHLVAETPLQNSDDLDYHLETVPRMVWPRIAEQRMRSVRLRFPRTPGIKDIAVHTRVEEFGLAAAPNIKVAHGCRVADALKPKSPRGAHQGARGTGGIEQRLIVLQKIKLLAGIVVAQNVIGRTPKSGNRGIRRFQTRDAAIFVDHLDRARGRQFAGCERNPARDLRRAGVADYNEGGTDAVCAAEIVGKSKNGVEAAVMRMPEFRNEPREVVGLRAGVAEARVLRFPYFVRGAVIRYRQLPRLGREIVIG